VCGTDAEQVEQLELSRPKATELLKAHEGDAVKAMSAFVTATV
jgi:NACalpha-BTF3-like transcription factor